MQLETKYKRLRTPVTIGSRFGDWEACAARPIDAARPLGVAFCT